jgi:hypothetical protein
MQRLRRPRHSADLIPAVSYTNVALNKLLTSEKNYQEFNFKYHQDNAICN